MLYESHYNEEVDLSNIECVIEYDSIFNYLILKNNSNRNVTIPIFIMKNIHKKVDFTKQRYNSVLRETVLNDVIMYCSLETIEKYDLPNNFTLSNWLLKAISMISNIPYDKRVEILANVLNTSQDVTFQILCRALQVE